MSVLIGYITHFYGFFSSGNSAQFPIRIHFGMSTILFLLFFLATDPWGRAGRVDDICATHNIQRMFLRLGESGVLTALNVAVGDSSDVSVGERCQVDILSCPSCSISLNFRFINLSCSCGTRFNLLLHNPCRCDFVSISEPPYDDSRGVSFCTSDAHGEDLAYKSKTRTVRIRLFYTRPHAHAFTLDYKSEPNRRFFFGTSRSPHQVNFSTGIVSSPFFPAAYPRDLIAEYVLTCTRLSNFSSLGTDDLRDGDANCRVHLKFTDFQLAPSSVMEFYEGSRRVGVLSGTSFRPPVIVSTTNSLMIRFYASGQASTGFKAVFSFISEDIVKNIVKPITDCGGYVDNIGGTITMMKMVKSEMKLFDCIWLIKPLSPFFNAKSHLYLKVISFRGFAGDTELQIRQGLTSESPALEKLRYPGVEKFQEHVIPLQSGFYVSLRGFFGPDSHFSVAYALFSHKRCVVFPGFVCRNFRCISEKLICDGFDHCGDNTDESKVCYPGWGSESGAGRDRRQGVQTPNYYFPKINEYAVVKTASTVFLISLVGLVLLVSSFALLLYLVEYKAQRQSSLQDELQSVSNFQDCLSDEVSVEDVVIDDPPSYEPPPNYDEVVKVPMKNITGDFQPNSTKERELRQNYLTF